MSSPFDAVTTYFLAKDGNRPFLMRRAFAEGVELQMDELLTGQRARFVGALGGERFAEFDPGRRARRQPTIASRP